MRGQKRGPSVAVREELPCSPGILPGNKIDPKEALRFQKRARYVAGKYGHPELADDFAQQIFVYFGEKPDRGATVDQLFIDYLRSTYGRSRESGHSARRLAEARTVSLDEPHGETEDSALNHDFIGDPRPDPRDSGAPREYSFLFRGRQAFIYDRYFLDQVSELTIANELGLTESRISQILVRMKKRIQDFAIRSDARERMEWDEKFGLVDVEWIKI